MTNCVSCKEPMAVHNMVTNNIPNSKDGSPVKANLYRNSKQKRCFVTPEGKR